METVKKCKGIFFRYNKASYVTNFGDIIKEERLSIDREISCCDPWCKRCDVKNWEEDLFLYDDSIMTIMGFSESQENGDLWKGSLQKGEWLLKKVKEDA